MDPLEEIKKRIDIVEFINKHVPLQKAGRNFHAPCPFHSEKTPSFIVSPDRQIWHCFGACNDGGDIFKFLMKWENLTFGEALRSLAEAAGVTIRKDAFVDRNYEKKQRLFTINQYAADFYQYLLEKHRLGEKGRRYLESRSVNQKTANYFGLGYAPKSWDSLFKYLTKKGYTAPEINATGLIIKTDQNHFYDRFRSRLMFPLTDLRGNILGFGGRILGEEEKELPADRREAKYVNTPETQVYHKREHLFGLHQANKEVREKNEIILVEGEFDAILAHQHGFKQTVAIKGSALTKDHLRLIKRLTNRITFALDMDAAGQEAVKRSIEEAEKFDFQMHVITLEGDKDPADVFSQHAQEFIKQYQHKQTIYEYLLDNFAKNNDLTTIYGKKAVVEAMLSYLYNIYNPILKDHYLKLVADKTAVAVETIKKSLADYKRSLKQKHQAEENLKVKERTKIEDALEHYLVAMLVQTDQQALIMEKVAKLESNDYYRQATFKLLEYAQNVFKNHSKDLITQLAASLPGELLDSYNQGFLWQLPEGEIDWHKEIHKNILNIKKHSLKRRIKELMKKDDEAALKNKLRELREVEKTLAIL